MAQAGKKRIVICADDFGMNPAVDAGILRLASQGRLNATSCLVEGSSFINSAKRLPREGLQLGLHLNFTESMARPGLYLPVSKLIACAWLRRLDPTVLVRQTARQLDVFESVIGRRPDFIDGHQHVHQFPQIRQALLEEIQRRYTVNPPWLRSTCSAAMPGVPLRLRLKGWTIEALGARRFATLARQRALPLNQRFLGVYDFQGGQAAYAGLLRQWLMHAGEGDVIMCHPAAHADSTDGLGPQREAEFLVLQSADVGDWMQRYGVVLA